jgi:hypothetical protein
MLKKNGVCRASQLWRYGTCVTSPLPVHIHFTGRQAPLACPSVPTAPNPYAATRPCDSHAPKAKVQYNTIQFNSIQFNVVYSTYHVQRLLLRPTPRRAGTCPIAPLQAEGTGGGATDSPAPAKDDDKTISIVIGVSVGAGAAGDEAAAAAAQLRLPSMGRNPGCLRHTPIHCFNSIKKESDDSDPPGVLVLAIVGSLIYVRKRARDAEVRTATNSTGLPLAMNALPPAWCDGLVTGPKDRMGPKEGLPSTW